MWLDDTGLSHFFILVIAAWPYVARPLPLGACGGGGGGGHITSQYAKYVKLMGVFLFLCVWPTYSIVIKGKFDSIYIVNVWYDSFSQFLPL